MGQTTNNNIENNTLKILSIQISLNGLSFCVKENNQVIVIKQDNFGISLNPEQVLNKIKYTFQHDETLKGDFSSIEVIYQNDLYTIVPKSLFNENSVKEYLKYNIKILENDFVAYDEIHQHDIVSVYIPYANINNFFFENFGSFTYKHSSTILINNLATREKNNNTPIVFANINQKYFDLIIIKKGKLVLLNTYKYETKEDFLYYVMFATEQLKLNPEKFTLKFIGDLTKDSDLYTIAYKYIRNIEFEKASDSVHISPNLSNFEPHQHFVLLSHF
ncbi:DUF3822 family protein [Aquimarina algicola]|uniref:DUF3822 family protein n=1 Tax=Aquimarina algicola TaxID=2589995 RepID=A0A504JNH4_9FLAO|nr:DUF3822 family protein [Aquimarina algicola]TPN89283.1 DUF3822 family protein [Aquimarina algicola]